ncbi:ankyrin repeat-containing domain protein [Coprinopsis sp. MPI-PUGE-AT-0042]|nr:ankyrin repeat-containing domain protein [Coprinopsis sp. MPI-PUGE-AT-0042]
MAALGIWLWSDPLSFGHGRRDAPKFAKANKCAVDSAVVAIAGQAVHLHSEVLRIISFILYSVLLVPGLNLILPMCMFFGLYLAWPPASRGLSWIRDISQASVERAERGREDYWHGRWCRTKTAVRTLHVRMGSSIPTSAQLEAVPAFLGLALLLAINLVFIIDIELTLGLNHALQEQDEEDWGFGQILAVLLLLLPLRDVVEAILARRLKQRQGELDEDLREGIERGDYERVKLAIDRGSSFPSPKSPEVHWKFWSLISTHGALEYFDNLRRTRMTTPEKAVEADLHSAIRAKNRSRIAAAYSQGADLIAGVLQLSTEAADMAFWCAISSGCQHIFHYYRSRLVQRVNEQGPDGETALMLASERGNEPFTQLLLENPLINVNLQDAKGRTALTVSAEHGHEAIAKILLERDDIQPNAADNDGWTPLIWASFRGHEAIAKMLLERDDIQPNAASEDGRTPLMWASHEGHEAIAKILLERGDIQPNVADKDSWTPLIWASCEGHEAIAKMLLEQDDIQLNAAAEDGWTPLMWASRNGHEAVVKMLLERDDIQLNAADNKGWTPLIRASYEGHKAIAKILLERGDIQPNAADNISRQVKSAKVI